MWSPEPFFQYFMHVCLLRCDWWPLANPQLKKWSLWSTHVWHWSYWMIQFGWLCSWHTKRSIFIGFPEGWLILVWHWLPLQCIRCSWQEFRLTVIDVGSQALGLLDAAARDCSRAIELQPTYAKVLSQCLPSLTSISDCDGGVFHTGCQCSHFIPVLWCFELGEDVGLQELVQPVQDLALQFVCYRRAYPVPWLMELLNTVSYCLCLKVYWSDWAILVSPNTAWGVYMRHQLICQFVGMVQKRASRSWLETVREGKTRLQESSISRKFLRCSKAGDKGDG